MSGPFADWITRSIADRALYVIDTQVSTERNLAAAAWLARRTRGRGSVFSRVEGFPGWRVAGQLLTCRADWSRAVGVAEGDLLAQLCRRLGAEIPPQAETAARLEETDRLPLPVPAASAPDARAGAAVLVLRGAPGDEPELFLARVVLASDGRAVITLDTPRLHAALTDRGASVRARLDAALVLGCDPALYLAAGIGTYGRRATFALAGGLAGRPIALAETSGMHLPADAQAVLRGTIDPAGVTVLDGIPGLAGRAACRVPATPFAVSRILAAPDPILFAAHVGAHPADWGGIASLAIETLTAAHLRDVEGGLNVLDVRCPVEAANQLVAVRILPRVEGQAKTALLAALSGPSTIARWAVAVDADVDPSDPRELFWSIASRTHAQSDVAVISGASVPTECLVYADDRGWPAVAGAKWFVDSTIPEVSDPEERSTFERARPRNWATVHLRDFLAPE